MMFVMACIVPSLRSTSLVTGTEYQHLENTMKNKMKTFLILVLVAAITLLLYVIRKMINLFILIEAEVNRLSEEVKTVHEKVVKDGDRD